MRLDIPPLAAVPPEPPARPTLDSERGRRPRAREAAAAPPASPPGGGRTPKKKRRKPGSTVKYLTGEELHRLFAVVKATRDRAIFRLAFHRGLRASEVGRLQMSHYRQSAERLYVTRLKGGNSGEYGLTSIESKALRAWIRDRGPAPGPIFLSRVRRAISQQQLDVLMKRYCAEASIPPEKAHFHALRHSCATALLGRGRDIAEVKDHLGHVSIANTDIYARITNPHRDRVANELRDWR